ncbi:MAG: hypothetical protein Q9191_002295 [Dirinaria sp. TL-2023a]
MTKEDASRIQSTQAKSGGDTSKGGFAARAQSAGDRNTNTSSTGQTGDNPGSGGQGLKSIFGNAPSGGVGAERTEIGLQRCRAMSAAELAPQMENEIRLCVTES